jgi:protein translocase SecG subunit
MNQALTIIQIVVSIALVGLILIQARGTGFGRSNGMGGASFTRRGLEKLVFRLTFVVSLLFIVTSVLRLVY